VPGEFDRDADLEIGDTAGLETCAMMGSWKTPDNLMPTV